MPPEKCLRLNNQEGLPPCSNGLCQKHQQDAIPLGAHGSFALSTKDDELLAEERIFSDKFGFPSGKIRQRPEQQGSVQRTYPTQEAILEDVKAGTDQVFDGDEDTRHKMKFSSLKMGGLSEHEGRANFVDCTLISRFSARKRACQIMLKMPILRTDDSSSQHGVVRAYAQNGPR
jgi:hypothetical protein